MFCKIILPSNEIHKLPSVPKSYEELHQIALRKFKGKVPENFYFKYKDTDDELITLSNDEDFQTAVVTSEADKVKILRIFLIPEVISENPNENATNFNFSPNLQESPNKLSINQARSNLSMGEGSAQGYGKISSDPTGNLRADDFFKQNNKDYETVDQMKKSQSSLPPIELQEDPLEIKKDISFDGNDFNNRSHKKSSEEATGRTFSNEQFTIISEMLEKKIKDKIEQKVELAMKDFMENLQEDVRDKTMKRSPYQRSPFMSKSVIPSYGSYGPIGTFGMKSSLRKGREQQDQGEYYCTVCKQKIENVRYTCLDCADFVSCESCEEKNEHFHPLLKCRIPREHRPSYDSNEALESNFHNAHPPPNFNSEARGNFGNPMIANKSHSIGVYKGNESLYHSESKNNRNMGSSSDANNFSSTLRYSNSMAYINLDDKNGGDSNGSHQTKNQGSFNNNRSPMSAYTDSSKGYGKSYYTPNPGEAPNEKETKKYKAVIVKPPIYDLINVKPGDIYKVEFTIKNAGSERWPEDIKLFCINGVHKGVEEELPALNAGQKFEVKLTLKAPQEGGRYLSQWRLQYSDEGTPKPFGSNLFVEINVPEGQKKDKGFPPEGEKKKEEKKKIDVGLKQQENKRELKKGQEKGPKEPENTPVPIVESKEKAKPELIKEEIPPFNNKKEEAVFDKSGLTLEERQLIQETKCSEMVLKHAQLLHSVFSDEDIRKQIDFVEECPIHLDINEIFLLYSTKMDKSAGN